MSEEMNEKEAELRAKRMSDMSIKIATDTAEAFEQWLEDNKNASKEEAHERLVKTIESAMMMHTMMLIMS